MKKKIIRRSLSFLCTLALMFSLAIPALAVDNEVMVNEANEIYLSPTKIDENKYVYLDENGEVLISVELLSDRAPTVVKGTPHDFYWELGPGESKHDNVDIETNGVMSIYVNAIVMNLTLSYVGYYSTASSTYYWIEPPSSSQFNMRFSVASSHIINFAMRNAGTHRSTYMGSYTLS